MTLIEQNYQKLAQAVILKAYKDNAKNWLKNKWNFNLFCSLAQVDSKVIQEGFHKLKKVEINTKGSRTQLAKDLGVSYSTVDYWIKKYNSVEKAVEHIKSGNHKYNTHSKCDEHYDYIVKMRKAKMKYQDIANRLGVSYSTVYEFCKKRGIK